MKKSFLCVCVKCHLTCLTAAICIRSNRARAVFVDILTELTDLTAKNKKVIYILFFLRSYTCFYWSNWSNRSNLLILCGVAAFVHRSNFLCIGQIALLRAAFIGQTRCQIAFCVNCYKLDACFILSTLRVSSLRPCVLTGRPICQAIARTHTRRGGDDHFGFFGQAPIPRPNFDLTQTA